MQDTHRLEMSFFNILKTDLFLSKSGMANFLKSSKNFIPLQTYEALKNFSKLNH